MLSGSELVTRKQVYPGSVRCQAVVAVEHKLFAFAIKNLLEPEYQVSHLVEPTHATYTATRLSPSILILECSVSELMKFRSESTTTKIIYLATDPSPCNAASAIRAGASGYVLKYDSVQEFLAAVRSVASGKTYISKAVPTLDVKILLSSRRQKHDFGITLRQMEVLRLLIKGKSMKEVACALSVSAATVAFHKYRIMEKLNLTNNAELIRYGVQHLAGSHVLNAPIRAYAQAGD